LGGATIREKQDGSLREISLTDLGQTVGQKGKKRRSSTGKTSKKKKGEKIIEGKTYIESLLAVRRKR